MNSELHYTKEEIQRFLSITKSIENEEANLSLKKLLSVQDKISIFRDIDPSELRAILYDVKFVKVAFREHIVDEAEDSLEIFFIIDGECQVFHDRKKVAALKPGEVFGESGVIFKMPRNATVVCASQNATLLSFKIDENNMDFCAPALAKLYKNFAKQINAKLQEINSAYIKK